MIGIFFAICATLTLGSPCETLTRQSLTTSLRRAFQDDLSLATSVSRQLFPDETDSGICHSMLNERAIGAIYPLFQNTRLKAQQDPMNASERASHLYTLDHVMQKWKRYIMADATDAQSRNALSVLGNAIERSMMTELCHMHSAIKRLEPCNPHIAMAPENLVYSALFE